MVAKNQTPRIKKQRGSLPQEEHDEVFLNSIEGTFGELVAGQNKKTFILHTSFPRVECVECFFPEELFDSIKKAAGSFGSVWGECFYKDYHSPSSPKVAIPHKINVRSIEIFPPSQELPSWEELRGVAPNITGGKSPEQFIREKRDEWQRKVDKWWE